MNLCTYRMAVRQVRGNGSNLSLVNDNLNFAASYHFLLQQLCSDCEFFFPRKKIISVIMLQGHSISFGSLQIGVHKTTFLGYHTNSKIHSNPNAIAMLLIKKAWKV